MSISAQDAFNKMSDHLMKQKKRSVIKQDGVKTCLYRHPDGLMCAVGAIIPNEFYHEGLEELHASVLPLYRKNEPFENLDPGFLLDIQVIHDSTKPSKWAKELRDLAKKYNLEVPDIIKKK